MLEASHTGLPTMFASCRALRDAVLRHHPKGCTLNIKAHTCSESCAGARKTSAQLLLLQTDNEACRQGVRLCVHSQKATCAPLHVLLGGSSGSLQHLRHLTLKSARLCGTWLPCCLLVGCPALSSIQLEDCVICQQPMSDACSSYSHCMAPVAGTYPSLQRLALMYVLPDNWFPSNSYRPGEHGSTANRWWVSEGLILPGLTSLALRFSDALLPLLGTAIQPGQLTSLTIEQTEGPMSSPAWLPRQLAQELSQITHLGVADQLGDGALQLILQLRLLRTLEVSMAYPERVSPTDCSAHKWGVRTLIVSAPNVNTSWLQAMARLPRGTHALHLTASCLDVPEAAVSLLQAWIPHLVKLARTSPHQALSVTQAASAKAVELLLPYVTALSLCISPNMGCLPASPLWRLLWETAKRRMLVLEGNHNLSVLLAPLVCKQGCVLYTCPGKLVLGPMPAIADASTPVPHRQRGPGSFELSLALEVLHGVLLAVTIMDNAQYELIECQLRAHFTSGSVRWENMAALAAAVRACHGGSYGPVAGVLHNQFGVLALAQCERSAEGQATRWSLTLQSDTLPPTTSPDPGCSLMARRSTRA